MSLSGYTLRDPFYIYRKSIAMHAKMCYNKLIIHNRVDDHAYSAIQTGSCCIDEAVLPRGMILASRCTNVSVLLDAFVRLYFHTP